MFCIYFRYFFAMMSRWEMPALALFHSSIQPIFVTPSSSRRSRYTKQRQSQYASSEITPGVDDVEPGAVTPLFISVKTPATTHEVSISAIGKVDGGDSQEPL
jgi:hypothetical protein